MSISLVLRFADVKAARVTVPESKLSMFLLQLLSLSSEYVGKHLQCKKLRVDGNVLNPTHLEESGRESQEKLVLAWFNVLLRRNAVRDKLVVRATECVLISWWDLQAAFIDILSYFSAVLGLCLANACMLIDLIRIRTKMMVQYVSNPSKTEPKFSI